MQQGIDLSGLKEIHLPQMPSIWPLAWGWWILLGIIVLLSVWFVLLLRQRRQLTAKKYAFREIQRLKNEYRDDHYMLASEISLLLRRIALHQFPREEVANLYGRKWRQFLEKTSKKPVFSGRAGDIVEHVLYLPPDRFRNEDIAPLITAAEEWIDEHT